MKCPSCRTNCSSAETNCPVCDEPLYEESDQGKTRRKPSPPKKKNRKKRKKQLPEIIVAGSSLWKLLPILVVVIGVGIWVFRGIRDLQEPERGSDQETAIATAESDRKAAAAATALREIGGTFKTFSEKDIGTRKIYRGKTESFSGSSIVSLSLAGDLVADKHIELIIDYAREKQLDTVSLRGTNVTDACVPHLKKLTGVTFLNIAETKITDAGVTELKTALPDCEVYFRSAPSL